MDPDHEHLEKEALRIGRSTTFEMPCEGKPLASLLKWQPRLKLSAESLSRTLVKLLARANGHDSSAVTFCSRRLTAHGRHASLTLSIRTAMTDRQSTLSDSTRFLKQSRTGSSGLPRVQISSTGIDSSEHSRHCGELCSWIHASSCGSCM